jgi:hypothetical protein
MDVGGNGSSLGPRLGVPEGISFFANLALLYPTVTFISWEIGVNLLPVNFVFCSQWIPPLTHHVWKYEMLIVMFASVQ